MEKESVPLHPESPTGVGATGGVGAFALNGDGVPSSPASEQPQSAEKDSPDTSAKTFAMKPGYGRRGCGLRARHNYVRNSSLAWLSMKYIKGEFSSKQNWMQAIRAETHLSGPSTQERCHHSDHQQQQRTTRRRKLHTVSTKKP